MAAMDQRKAGFGLPPSVWRPISNVLAALMTLTAIGWALSVNRYFGLGLYPQQFFAAMLVFVLPIAYLTLPARQGATRETVPLYDVALGLLSMAAFAFIAVGYPDLVLMIFSRPLEVWLPGLIAIALTLEALRRATGWGTRALDFRDTNLRIDKYLKIFLEKVTILEVLLKV